MAYNQGSRGNWRGPRSANRGYPGEGIWGDRDYPGEDLQGYGPSGGWVERPPYAPSGVTLEPTGPEFAGQGVYGDLVNWRPDDRGSRDYRGVGPRGYQRSNERIREEIHERLTDDPYVDPTDVEVQVQDGIVTLSGAIPDRAMKRRTEDDVAAIRGVRDVRNLLRTGDGSQQSGSPTGSTERTIPRASRR
jgi:hypothetical protein